MSDTLRLTMPVKAVLRAMLPGRSYGSQLAARLKTSTGTVYVILYRLEREGLAVSTAETPAERDPSRSGPLRRYWELTPAGSALARSLA